MERIVAVGIGGGFGSVHLLKCTACLFSVDICNDQHKDELESVRSNADRVYKTITGVMTDRVSL